MIAVTDHSDVLPRASTFVVNYFELGATMAGIAADGGTVEKVEPVAKHHGQWQLAAHWPSRLEPEL
jgi:hypothetical protein